MVSLVLLGLVVWISCICCWVVSTIVNLLAQKTRPRNVPLYVQLDIKFYSLTCSMIYVCSNTR